ncbi:MAG: NADH-quinone oxidoreductase subunit K [Candidatus Omnitrophica bacterium]|nr:NADH-quinone oxidoreductase subunit K [Candidatus Omnitrophota bacterium]
MIYFLCMVLFAIGLYGVLRKRNLVKIILGLVIIEYATHLLFILIGYRMNGRAPILAEGEVIANIVDPLPQALVLTAIVISLGVTALVVSLAIRIYDRYRTFDITKIRRLRG